MTGPIRRLARDAVSPTRPTIHAMARLPYMPQPALLPIGEAGTPSASRAPATTMTAWPATSATPNSGALHGPRAPVADGVARSIDTDVSAEPGYVQSVASRPPSSLSPSSAHPSSRLADPFPAALMPTSPAPGPTPQGAAPGATDADDETDASARSKPSSAFEPAQGRAAPQTQAPDQPATHSANPRTLPEALLPLIRQGARSTLSSPAAASAQRTPPAAESPTEVHVHIGRIEVTAVQPSAAPKPAARGGPQPMSLDEYLARRERRGS